MSRPFLAILGVCCVVGLIGYAAATEPGQPTNLKALALRANDVQRHLLAGPAGYWSNAEAARRDGVPVAVYDRGGPIRSYHNSFTPDFSVRISFAGLERADSEIGEYKDAAAAHWGWLQMRAAMRHAVVMEAPAMGTPAGPVAQPVPFKPIAVPRVGNEDAGFAVTWLGFEFTYYIMLIFFM
jgi:hypothetical protein